MGRFHCAALLLMAFLIAVSIHTQRPSGTVAAASLLQRSLGKFVANYGSLEAAAVGSLFAAEAQGGVATVEGCQTVLVRNFRVTGPTLLDALQSIIKTDPQYRWEVRDDAVDLLPVGPAPPLLSVQIKQFDSKDATTLTDAASLLLQTPEIREVEAKLGFNKNINSVQLGPYAVPPPGESRQPERLLAVRLQNVTALDALNAIVRAHGHSVWVYREWHCRKSNGFRIRFVE